MIDLKTLLPFWMSGAQAQALARAAADYWGRMEGLLTEAGAQADIAGCSLPALEAHAADRSVARFPDEPEGIWRGRVQKAFTTAVNAGSRAGLELLLGAHGVQGYAVSERIAGEDWDVVAVALDPDTLSAESGVLDRIFHEWGRVCRRYVITHIVPTPVYPLAIGINEQQHVETAI